MVLVKVKHGKATYEVELDQSKDVQSFKALLQGVTNVPPERQSLMGKGLWIGTLKDDKDLSTLKVKPGQLLTLMGSADVLKEVPKNTVKFIEDMTSDEKAAVGAAVSAGLVNLGNTCYMNSLVQCLRHMPELRTSIETAPPVSTPLAGLAKAVVAASDNLDKSGAAIAPHSLVATMRRVFPQFMEGVMEGRPAQQDAEELYNALAQSIQEALREPSILPATDWESILGVEMEETLTCTECDEEAVIKKTEKVNKLVCNIQNSLTQGKNIDHMQEGVRLGLEGSLEKNSEVLGRNAMWSKTQKIKKLPRYLCFHFMRFFWKATPDSREHEGLKCKIMRSVTYPEVFDVYEFCNGELQEKLKANRDMQEKLMEEQLNRKRAKLSESEEMDTGNGSEKADATASADANDKMDEDSDEDDAEALQKALAMSMEGSEGAAAASTVFTSTSLKAAAPSGNPFEPQGLPANFTGMYELHSLVTHKGRTADGGHYIGWVRQEPGSSKWWQYNDDKVSETDIAEIKLLCGGGDRDITYLAFYRFRDPSAS